MSPPNDGRPSRAQRDPGSWGRLSNLAVRVAALASAGGVLISLRMPRVAIAVAAALVIAIAAGLLVRDRLRDGQTPASAANATECVHAWSYCAPAAPWLRRVLSRAGISDVGSTAAAFIVPTERGEIYVWATTAVHGRRAGSKHERVMRFGETDVYTDGVRAHWQAQRWNVWVEPPPARRFLTRLVQAASATQPDATGEHGG